MVNEHADEWNILPLVKDDVKALRRMTSREIIKKSGIIISFSAAPAR